MKHLLTFAQFLLFIIMDCLLFIWHFKWNMYLFKFGYEFVKGNYFVYYASNYDRRSCRKMSKNKYEALLF